MKFAITGLPRSRTAWFAAYFTACGYKCAHEGMNGCGSIKEYEKEMESFDGNSDCGIAFLPFDGNTVIIERDKNEVKRSLSRFFDDTDVIDLSQERLDKLDGLRVKFKDIDDKLQEIHEYCVGNTYDPYIAKLFKNMSISMKTLTITNDSSKLLGELLWRG